MRKLSILAAVAAMAMAATAAGAAPKIKTQPLTPELAARMSGKVIAETRHSAGNFSARTPGRGAAGIIGNDLSNDSGARLVARDKIVNPSEAISGELTRVLIEKTGAKRSPAKAFAIGGTIADLAVSGGPGVQYILDVGTDEWGFKVVNKGRYGAFYKSTVRVVEVSSQTVVMTATCDWNAEGVRTFSDAEIKAVGSAGVKEHLAVATEVCTAQYKRKLFGAE